MARLLLINANSKNEQNNLGDIVTAVDDNIQLSQNELENFDVVSYEVGKTGGEVWQEIMDTVYPQVNICWKDGDTWKSIDPEPPYYFRYVSETQTIIHNFV